MVSPSNNIPAGLFDTRRANDGFELQQRKCKKNNSRLR